MTRSRLLLPVATFAALVALAVVAWQWQAESGASGGRRVITVGLYENAPKVYTAENGRPAGLFVELLDEMARIEGWQLRYVPCQWADCLEQLKQGQLDLMPDVAYSIERDWSYDFHSVSVASSWSQVYSNPRLKVMSMADLAGKRVAILQGGIQQSFFAQLMGSGNLGYLPVAVTSLDQGYAAVVAGEADAVVTNSFFAARNGGKYKLQETPIVFLPSNLYFATANGRNTDLLERIDVHLTAWRGNADSIYFDALHRAMAAPPEVLVPHWVRWLFAALGAALALLIAVSLLLRWQVEQRTRALVQTTKELEEQRANLEQLVVERTRELAAAKEEAERLTQVKSDFLANMSHEIRTPMNAILGLLYLALKKELPPALRRQLTKAQGAARSLLGIINDILDFSKIEAGKLDIEQVEFGLDAVLEQLTDAIGYQVEHKGIEFLIRYDVSIPPLLIGDPLRLGQIMLNLCSNAVKFTEQGEVELAFRRINASETDLTIQVCVRDSGIGMTPEVQTKLFEKFTQADQSTTRRFGGTGLGLAISKNLVELMGGRIWVEDSQPGKGTTICFTARLKIARESPRNELIEQVGPLLQDIRVLVVDDNQVSREILAEMLRFFHLEVDVVVSGPAALTTLVAAEKPYDLVLMDWRMPGMNGDEAIQRIHREAGLARQPKVVMVTAYGGEDVIRLAEQAEVDGFLIKPVLPSTLLDTILSVLGRGRILGNDGKRRPSAPDLATCGLLAGARLLLVEDNDINREFATELLRSEGIEVDEAENGQIAVDKVQQQDYDGVLMDIQMPVMDGLEAARRIRALAKNPGSERFAALPIIAMTALAMAQDTKKSQAAGMNDHVTKPIVPNRLMAALARWVRLPDARRGRPASLPAGTASPSGEIPADLQALTSLDAYEGIRRIGGKADAYRRQLRRFREHYPGAIAELRRLIAEKDLERAEEYCHALKGVSGNVGAHALFGKITAIDNRLKQGEVPDEVALEEAETLLGQLMREIDGMPPPVLPAAAMPLTPVALREQLALLDHALKYDLGAVEALLTRLRIAVAGTPHETEVAAIAALVDVFDVDAALAQLRKLEASDLVRTS
ncbi:MAG: response regulator [Sulfuritalea sp.]|jgi:signal transduction histidine kinase/DNA-binding response OmpR family regulator/HPt (histidine-containing phosphotransfer) domain-containing protein|nr:response regulator [Sulfuritalea sp.]